MALLLFLAVRFLALLVNYMAFATNYDGKAILVVYGLAAVVAHPRPEISAVVVGAGSICARKCLAATRYPAHVGARFALALHPFVTVTVATH
jgi:hypothetical protein